MRMAPTLRAFSVPAALRTALAPSRAAGRPAAALRAPRCAFAHLPPTLRCLLASCQDARTRVFPAMQVAPPSATSAAQLGDSAVCFFPHRAHRLAAPQLSSPPPPFVTPPPLGSDRDEGARGGAFFERRGAPAVRRRWSAGLLMARRSRQPPWSEKSSLVGEE